MIEDEEMAREFKLNISKLRPELSWGEIMRPLDRFCSNPTRAADNLVTPPVRRVSPARRLAGRMALAWEEGGVQLVVTRAAGYVSRKVKTR
jgi:hypothetical protein